MSNFWEDFLNWWSWDGLWTWKACHSEGVGAVSALMLGHTAIGTVPAGFASVTKLLLLSKECAQRQLCSLLLDPRESVHSQHAQTICCRTSEAHCEALEEEDAGAVDLKVLEHKNSLQCRMGYHLRCIFNVYCSVGFNILLYMLEMVSECGFGSLQML